MKVFEAFQSRSTKKMIPVTPAGAVNIYQLNIKKNSPSLGSIFY
jgi:hypothetical protein